MKTELELIIPAKAKRLRDEEAARLAARGARAWIIKKTEAM